MSQPSSVEAAPSVRFRLLNLTHDPNLNVSATSPPPRLNLDRVQVSRAWSSLVQLSRTKKFYEPTPFDPLREAPRSGLALRSCRAKEDPTCTKLRLIAPNCGFEKKMRETAIQLRRPDALRFSGNCPDNPPYRLNISNLHPDKIRTIVRTSDALQRCNFVTPFNRSFT
jgi:hypothetical protein